MACTYGQPNPSMQDPLLLKPPRFDIKRPGAYRFGLGGRPALRSSFPLWMGRDLMGKNLLVLVPSLSQLQLGQSNPAALVLVALNASTLFSTSLVLKSPDVALQACSSTRHRSYLGLSCLSKTSQMRTLPPKDFILPNKSWMGLYTRGERPRGRA